MISGSRSAFDYLVKVLPYTSTSTALLSSSGLSSLKSFGLIGDFFLFFILSLFDGRFDFVEFFMGRFLLMMVTSSSICKICAAFAFRLAGLFESLDDDFLNAGSIPS